MKIKQLIAIGIIFVMIFGQCVYAVVNAEPIREGGSQTTTMDLSVRGTDTSLQIQSHPSGEPGDPKAHLKVEGKINGIKIGGTHIHSDGSQTPKPIDTPPGAPGAQVRTIINPDGSIAIVETDPQGKSGSVIGDPDNNPGHLTAINSKGDIKKCSLCKILGRVGGISTNISAQFLENLTDIKAVVYDPYLEELIFVGVENYSMPKMDLDDLAAALQVPKEDQYVTIDVNPETCDVSFGDLRLANSSTGYKLFSADYLLKNMTLDNVSDCVCWKRCGGDETRRIWIYPNESVLNVTNNSFVWNKFSVGVSQEYLSGRSDNCTSECWNSWANYLANNFINLSKDHEEWNKILSTAKTASIANWIKDNNINYSWFLENYTRKQNTTPTSVPTQHNKWWMCQCNESDCGNCNVSLTFTKQGSSYTWVPEQFTYEDCNTFVAGGDDLYTTYSLPFNFPFYDSQYSTMYIQSNGHITLDSPDSGWSGFWSKYINHKMIALDARDLITNIYVCNHQNYVTVRLTGGYYGKTTSVDVEALLYQNGTIKLMLKDAGAYTDHWGNGIITGVSDGTGGYTTATIDLYGGATLDFNNSYVANGNVEAIKLTVLSARPYEDEVVWNVSFDGHNYTAVALSLGNSKQINYSVDYNNYDETPLSGDADYNAYVVSIVPSSLGISSGVPLNLDNISVQGKDIMANVSLKLVPLNSTHIQERSIISQNSFNTTALWEPPVNKNTSLQMPSNLKRGSYQIYAEIYANGTLQDIAVSDFIYYTPIEGYLADYNASQYTYNVTDNSIIGGDCYSDGNLSDCYMSVNYVKREGDDIEFSFNLTGSGDGLIYANENLIGNLSFYEDNYTFVIPNLNSSKTNIISIKIFDHDGEVYYILNITINATIFPDPWWNCLWDYRTPINLTETSGSSLQDYQVALTINTQELISGGSMNANCSDMRFVDTGKDIPYWLESGCNTNTTKVWVKVNLTGNETKTIYVYYGNSNAVSKNSSDDVFDFFDDFNGDVLNTSKWAESGTSGALIISNGIATIHTYQTGWRAILANQGFNSSQSHVVEMKARHEALRYGESTATGLANSSGGFKVYFAQGDVILFNVNMIACSESYGCSGALGGTTNWALLKFVFNTSDVLFYRDDALKWSSSYISQDLYPSIIASTWGNWGSFDTSLSVDYIKARKYASSEPGISIGTEQQNPWWNCNWKQRKAIDIKEVSGKNLTDYQTRITINTASLISQGKLNANCSDIRFIDNNTELPYWIEQGCNSSSTIIWIKVNLTANNKKIIYMYYGNPNAGSKSNGTKTFELFEDFPDGNLNNTLWDHAFLNSNCPSGDVWSEQSYNGEYCLRSLAYRKYSCSNSWVYNNLSTKNVDGGNFYNQDKVVDIDLYAYTTDGCYGCDQVIDANLTFSIWNGTSRITYQNPIWNSEGIEEGCQCSTNFHTLNSDTRHKWTFKFSANNKNVRVFKDDAELSSSPFDLSSLSNRWSFMLEASGHNFQTAYNADLQFMVYKYGVRKYASSEPSTSVRAEESN